jgi:two-component system, OmpR family, sensor histidine kinase VicK
VEQQQARSLSILALTQGIAGGIIAGVVGFLYWQYPELIRQVSIGPLMGGLGIFSLLYFLGIHQLIKKRFLGLSALFLTLLTCSNLLLLISQTGGLESPFYSFWLLVIVMSGIFGPIHTLAMVTITTAYFAIVFTERSFEQPYIVSKIPLMMVTLAAIGLAEWVYSRGRKVATSKQRAESLSGKLSEEQLKAQALMSFMADGVVAVDHSLSIQLFNQAAQIMTGWDEASAQNMNYRFVMNLKTPDDKDVINETDPFIEAWNSKQPVVKDNLYMLTRAGRKIALSMSISPVFDTGGNASGAICVFRDISKEKEVERQRNEFISTASHEMRTPVAAIEGYIALAMNPAVATIDDRAKNYLSKAHDNTRHLGELFKDLLSITKIEEGEVAKNLVPVDLGKIVHDVVDDMQPVASQKGLSLTFTSGKSTGKTIMPIYTVVGDHERLREVTMNLIDNAIKYTAEGGITVSIAGNDNQVTVSVTDTGTGIPAEDIPHLFQKFYRVDSSATRTVGGTGLGLYLCRSIIERHNGRIWVNSVNGRGSAFSYSLPRIAATAPIVSPKTTPLKPAAQLVEAIPPNPTAPKIDGVTPPTQLIPQPIVTGGGAPK